MARNAKRAITVVFDDKKHQIHITIFNRPQVDYSGFGAHRTSRKSKRAKTRKEERNWREELD